MGGNKKVVVQESFKKQLREDLSLTPKNKELLASLRKDPDLISKISDNVRIFGERLSNSGRVGKIIEGHLDGTFDERFDEYYVTKRQKTDPSTWSKIRNWLKHDKQKNVQQEATQQSAQSDTTQRSAQPETAQRSDQSDTTQPSAQSETAQQIDSQGRGGVVQDSSWLDVLQDPSTIGSIVLVGLGVLGGVYYFWPEINKFFGGEAIQKAAKATAAAQQTAARGTAALAQANTTLAQANAAAAEAKAAAAQAAQTKQGKDGEGEDSNMMFIWIIVGIFFVILVVAITVCLTCGGKTSDSPGRRGRGRSRSRSRSRR